MPIKKLLVFISSTSDLRQERDAVAQALPMSFDPYLYEKDDARVQSPREHLRDKLGETDVFVGIHGARYGSVYPNCENDPSIVEWEFDTAKEIGVPELLGFLKEASDPSAVDPRQRQFLEKLTDFSEGSWVKSYRSPEQLHDLVQGSLLGWLADYYMRLRPAREAFAVRIHEWLQRASFLLIYALLVLVIGFRQALSDTALLAATGIVATLIVAFMVLLVIVWRPHHG